VDILIAENMRITVVNLALINLCVIRFEITFLLSFVVFDRFSFMRSLPLEFIQPLWSMIAIFFFFFLLESLVLSCTRVKTIENTLNARGEYLPAVRTFLIATPLYSDYRRSINSFCPLYAS